jgi:sialate O-acetylesterase
MILTSSPGIPRLRRPSNLALVGLVLVLAWLSPAAALAKVSLPDLFSDHMVLQADREVPVWGWAEPSEEVTVAIAGQTKTATADPKGKWLVKLNPLKAGEALTLTVKGGNTITIQDVLVGEVWLCSGQSNMQMTVSAAKDFPKEKAAANYPKIRMFREASNPATTPQDHCKGTWQVCSPETVGGFSATGYFFGRELHQTLGVPVGLINSSVGGTAIEAWTSLEAQKDKPEVKPIFERWTKQAETWDPAKAQAQYDKQLAAYKEAAAKARAEGKRAPAAPRKPVDPRLNANHPANLFNAKIAPLVPYAIRGAIWYQGESNAGNLAGIYGLQLETLIKDWRSRWGEGDFPFAWVQLPNFRAPQTKPVESSNWALVREGMLKTLALPNTGMAITIDVGEANDIHPKDKQDVGKRLAMWALAKVYGRPVASSGPLVASHKISGSQVILSFKHTDGGLVAKEGTLKGFAIAGADGNWVRAEAKIAGDQVIVSSPDVKDPVAVRYDWADNPDGNLYNGAGLPASPFRTDDRPAASQAPK